MKFFEKIVDRQDGGKNGWTGKKTGKNYRNRFA